MLIILEGLDCSGKSYIATQLLRALPHCYYLKHGNRPKDKSIKEINRIKETYRDMLHAWDAIWDIDNNMIFDRFFPSELVYSLPKRGYEAFDDPDYQEIEKLILKENAPHIIVLYVFASTEELVSRMKVRGEDYMELGDIDKLKARYNAFLNSTKIPVVRIQSGTDIKEILEKINEYR